MPVVQRRFEIRSEARHRQLVERILEGDEDSLAELYDEVSPRIYHYGLRRLRNHQDAEDLAQEVFVRVIQGLPGYEGRSRFLTWVFGIANFLALRQLHGKHRKWNRMTPEELAALPDPQTQISPERNADAALILERCGEVLERNVSNSQRRIFEMMYAENASMGQISKALGIRTSAVKSSLHHTRRLLTRWTHIGKL